MVNGHFRAPSIVALLFTLLSGGVAAQTPPEQSIYLGGAGSLLTDGDDPGTEFQLQYRRGLNSRFGLQFGASFLNSTERSAKDAVVDADWRERKFLLVDIVPTWEFAAFRTERVAHAFDLGMGVGYAYGKQEREFLVLAPVAYRLFPEQTARLIATERYHAYYRVEYSDGPGGYEDGLYGFMTSQSDGHEVGLHALVDYRVQVGRISTMASGGVRLYTTAGFIYSWGLKVGYVF